MILFFSKFQKSVSMWSNSKKTRYICGGKKGEVIIEATQIWVCVGLMLMTLSGFGELCKNKNIFGKLRKKMEAVVYFIFKNELAIKVKF